MAKTKYFIELNESERELLQRIVDEGTEHEKTIMRARILLATDDLRTTRKCSVEKLAQKLGTTHTTVQSVRADYGKGGMEYAVFKKPRVVSMTNRKINEDVIAKILALAEEKPPEGCKKWTLRMLCDECEARGIVKHIVPTSMSKVLKQRKQS